MVDALRPGKNAVVWPADEVHAAIDTAVVVTLRQVQFNPHPVPLLEASLANVAHRPVRAGGGEERDERHARWRPGTQQHTPDISDQ